MSDNKTSNYKLNKPTYDEFGDIDDLNENADIIDKELAERANKVKSPVEGNFAALTSDGNITDSGKKASDFVDLEALNTKADKSKSILITLSVDSWTSETSPYSYTISDTDITATNMIDITFRSGVTEEVTDAWDAAEIKRYLQNDRELILYADGDKPSIDIPLHMIIRGDV